MKRILIADDDPDICSFLCRIVRKTVPEAHIDIARNGEKCLEKLYTTSFDLALLEVQMSDISGLDVLRTARRENLNVNILLLSGWATAEMAQLAARAGARDLLEKPIIVHEIIGALCRFFPKIGIPVGKS